MGYMGVTVHGSSIARSVEAWGSLHITKVGVGGCMGVRGEGEGGRER